MGYRQMMILLMRINMKVPFSVYAVHLSFSGVDAAIPWYQRGVLVV